DASRGLVALVATFARRIVRESGQVRSIARDNVDLIRLAVRPAPGGGNPLEDDPPPVRRPVRFNVGYELLRIRHLAYLRSVSVCGEDRAPGVLLVEPAAECELPVAARRRRERTGREGEDGGSEEDDRQAPHRDQTGPLSPNLLLVRRFKPLPSAFIT